VAYISSRKLYVTDVEVISSLRVGGLGWRVRKNGNVSFGRMR